MKYLIIQAIISLLIIFAVFVFDRQLNLGDLQGVALRLYGLYVLAAQMLISVIVGIVFIFRKKQGAIYFLVLSIVVPLLAGVLVILIS